MGTILKLTNKKYSIISMYTDVITVDYPFHMEDKFLSNI